MAYETLYNGAPGPLYYGSAAGARAYWAARAIAVPVADDPTVLVWLLTASEWIDGKYRADFPGYKVGLRAQIREWPRIGGLDMYGYLIDQSVEPAEIDNATYEAAALLGNGTPLLVNYTASKYDSVQIVGAIAVKYNSSATADSVQTQFPVIDRILQPVLTGIGDGVMSGLSGRTVRV